MESCSWREWKRNGILHVDGDGDVVAEMTWMESVRWMSHPVGVGEVPAMSVTTMWELIS